MQVSEAGGVEGLGQHISFKPPQSAKCVSPTSKVHAVFHSLNTVFKFKSSTSRLSSEASRQSLSCNPVNSKSKSHTSSIQWHRIYITTPKGSEWLLGQNKTNSQQGKHQRLYSVSGGFRWGSVPSALLPASLSCWLYSLYALLLGMHPMALTLQYLGVPNSTQALLGLAETHSPFLAPML